MNIHGKEFHRIWHKGLSRYYIDDIGVVWDSEKERLMLPIVMGVLKHKLTSSVTKKAKYYHVSRLVLCSRNKCKLDEPDIYVYTRNGIWNDMRLENLDWHKVPFSIRKGSEFRYTQPTGRVFNFKNWEQFKYVYQGMSRDKLRRLMRGRLNGSTLEYRRNEKSEWIVVK